MTQVVIDIPEDLFSTISNKAQLTGKKFEEAALALLSLGASSLSADAEDAAMGDVLLAAIVARAKKKAVNVEFTTRDLAEPAEWLRVSPATRKSVGRSFSKNVREGFVGSVVHTKRKTPQNKNIYVRREV
ncbi:DUF1413 domain-containing protein [Pseudomonas sp. NA-150]|uniref:DUF1413 domain-containing protein n=1 Tax=Pseudomonas sp. NA-150 TaxID=3367525 RepID=UPI0037C6B568